nr:hypothetical protein [Haladaptatus sp. R4]
MSIGSRTTFIPAESTISHIAVRVSPAPRSTARKTKKRNVNGMEKNSTSMYPSACT